MSDKMRELLCQRCDREYVVWFAPNELWNAVARESEHFLCPTCFSVLSEERGILVIWRLSPVPSSTTIFPMHESDLKAMEEIIPQLASDLTTAMANPQRAEGIRRRLQQAKEILSNIRWNYGPPTEVEIISAGPNEPETD